MLDCFFFFCKMGIFVVLDCMLFVVVRKKERMFFFRLRIKIFGFFFKEVVFGYVLLYFELVVVKCYLFIGLGLYWVFVIVIRGMK